MISFRVQLPSEAPYGGMINELEVGNDVEGIHQFPVCRIIAIFPHAQRPITAVGIYSPNFDPGRTDKRTGGLATSNDVRPQLFQRTSVVTIRFRWTSEGLCSICNMKVCYVFVFSTCVHFAKRRNFDY